jgi:hypothetical protein
MNFSITLTKKVAEIRFVSRRLWISTSLWDTTCSDLRGWKAEWRPGGFRIITPQVGLGWCFYVGENRPNDASRYQSR